MKHTECENCKLREGDCGYHFKMNGKTNFDIASLSACDQYGNCEFFKPAVKRMTNKEAIKKLKKLLFMTGYKEALNLAIKALETADEVCEKCKYVDRSVHEFPCNECVYAYENHFTELKGGGKYD